MGSADYRAQVEKDIRNTSDPRQRIQLLTMYSKRYPPPPGFYYSVTGSGVIAIEQLPAGTTGAVYDLRRGRITFTRPATPPPSTTPTTTPTTAPTPQPTPPTTGTNGRSFVIDPESMPGGGAVPWAGKSEPTPPPTPAPAPPEVTTPKSTTPKSPAQTTPEPEAPPIRTGPAQYHENLQAHADAWPGGPPTEGTEERRAFPPLKPPPVPDPLTRQDRFQAALRGAGIFAAVEGLGMIGTGAGVPLAPLFLAGGAGAVTGLASQQAAHTVHTKTRVPGLGFLSGVYTGMLGGAAYARLSAALARIPHRGVMIDRKLTQGMASARGGIETGTAQTSYMYRDVLGRIQKGIITTPTSTAYLQEGPYRVVSMTTDHAGALTAKADATVQEVTAGGVMRRMAEQASMSSHAGGALGRHDLLAGHSIEYTAGKGAFTLTRGDSALYSPAVHTPVGDFGRLRVLSRMKEILVGGAKAGAVVPTQGTGLLQAQAMVPHTTSPSGALAALQRATHSAGTVARTGGAAAALATLRGAMTGVFTQHRTTAKPPAPPPPKAPTPPGGTAGKDRPGSGAGGTAQAMAPQERVARTMGKPPTMPRVPEGPQLTRGLGALGASSRTTKTAQAATTPPAPPKLPGERTPGTSGGRFGALERQVFRQDVAPSAFKAPTGRATIPAPPVPTTTTRTGSGGAGVASGLSSSVAKLADSMAKMGTVSKPGNQYKGAWTSRTNSPMKPTAPAAPPRPPGSRVEQMLKPETVQGSTPPRVTVTRPTVIDTDTDRFPLPTTRTPTTPKVDPIEKMVQRTRITPSVTPLEKVLTRQRQKQSTRTTTGTTGGGGGGGGGGPPPAWPGFRLPGGPGRNMPRFKPIVLPSWGGGGMRPFRAPGSGRRGVRRWNFRGLERSLKDAARSFKTVQIGPVLTSTKGTRKKGKRKKKKR